MNPRTKTHGKKNPHPKTQRGPLNWVKDKKGLKAEYYKCTGDFVMLRKEKPSVRLTETHTNLIERVLAFVEGEKANKTIQLRREIKTPHKDLRKKERAFIHADVSTSINSTGPRQETTGIKKTVIQARELNNPFKPFHSKVSGAVTKTSNGETRATPFSRETAPQDYKRLHEEK